MLYTANPPSIGWTTSAEPLAGSKATERTITRDVVTLMDDSYTALGGQKDKLLLGINCFPWPGVEFQCRTADRLAASIGLGKSQPFEYLDRNAQADGKHW